MSLVDLLFRRKNSTTRSAPTHSQPPLSQSQPSQTQSQLSSVQSQMSPQAAASQNATRRELLRVVLRDTLSRHGIPAAWITADMLAATSRQKDAGIHWRLAITHWDERLMVHTVSLQNALIKRVMSFDPLATHWLMGISWQLALEDESACPPMPHPGAWTNPAARAPERAAPVAAPAAGGVGDVISGPVLIGGNAAPDSATSAREDLDKLFAIRDQDRERHADDRSSHTFAATEPAKLDR